MKKSYIGLLIAVLLLFQSFAYVSADEAGGSEWSLTILHTNDTHAHLENITKRFTAVNQIRAEVSNSILLDAGDVFSGTLFFTKYLGKADAQFMNMLGYDAMTFGNHEFDKGPNVLADFIKELKFPIVSANVDVSTEPSLNGLFNNTVGEGGKGNGGKIFPALILEVNGEKVGLFGLTTEDTAFIASPGPNVKFNDAIETAQNTVKMLEEKGINKIIALTHLGIDTDRKLAETVDGIDVIVGGHSHTKIDTPEVYHKENTPTLVVQANEWGKYLGRLDVTFNQAGVLTKWDGQLIDINAKDQEGNFVLDDDQQAAALYAEYQKEIDAMANQVVGRTAVDLVGETALVRTQETNLGNLITDSILDKTAPLVGATIAIHNGGNIRASISKGEITMGQVRTVQPFGNSIVALELTGEQIIAALENGVSKVEEKKGQFPHVAGMKYTYDSRKPAGQRIISVEVKTEEGYQPIDKKASYMVATNSFLADGGDGYTVFKEAKDAGKMKDLFFTDYEIFVEYLAKKGEVSPQLEGRIVNLATQAEETNKVPSKEEPTNEKPAEGQGVGSDKSEAGKKEIVYIVKKGDVLWKIGKRYGIDWKLLAEYNKLKNPHLILIGQKLLIPAEK